MARFRRGLCPVDSNGPIDEFKFKEWMKRTDRQSCRLEPKYDGSRYLLHLHRKENHLTSRRKSVKTGYYSDRIKQVPHLRKLKISKDVEGTVLDGEVVSTSKKLAGEGGVAGTLNSKPKRARKLQKKYGKLVYMAFGVKRYGKRNLSKKPLSVRRKALEEILIRLKLKNPNVDEYIKPVPQIIPESWEHMLTTYKAALQEGFEGLMIKDGREPEGKGMWKLKMFRDACAVISGFTEGTGKYKNLIGAVKFSVYNKRKELVEIGQCSGMTDKVRKWMTRNQKKLIGKVIEFKGQTLGWDDVKDIPNRVRHPNYLRMRDDFPAQKCTVERVKRDLALI